MKDTRKDLMKLRLLERFLESNSEFECLMNDDGRVDYNIVAEICDDVPFRRYKRAYEGAINNDGYVDKRSLARKVAFRHSEYMLYFLTHEDEIIKQHEERCM